MNGPDPSRSAHAGPAQASGMTGNNTWLVDPAASFYCETCRGAHPIAGHRQCREASPGTESADNTPRAAKRRPSLFRWFRASVNRRPCPDCGCPTATGFDRGDTQAQSARCAACSADAISNEAVFTTFTNGYPLAEQGPCVSCGQPTRLYGPHGNPKCEPCRQPQATRPLVTPHPIAQARAEIPSPRREPQFEPEALL